MSALNTVLTDFKFIQSYIKKSSKYNDLKAEIDSVIQKLESIKPNEFVNIFKEQQDFFVCPLINCLLTHNNKLYSDAMGCISKLMMQNLLGEESYKSLLSEMVSYCEIEPEQFTKNIQVISTILTTPSILSIIESHHIMTAISILMTYYEIAPPMIKASTSVTFPLILESLFEKAKKEISEVHSKKKGVIEMNQKWTMTNDLLGLFKDLQVLSLGQPPNILEVSRFDPLMCLKLIKYIIVECSTFFVIKEYLDSLKDFISVLSKHFCHRTQTLSVAHSLIIPLLKYPVRIPFMAILPKPISEPWEVQSFFTICDTCISTSPTIERLVDCTSAIGAFLERTSAPHYPILSSIISDITSLASPDDDKLISVLWPCVHFLLSVFQDETVISMCIPVTTILLHQHQHTAIVALFTSLTKLCGILHNYVPSPLNDHCLNTIYTICETNLYQFGEEEYQIILPVLDAVSNLSDLPDKSSNFSSLPHLLAPELPVSSLKILLSAFSHVAGLCVNSGSMYYSREYLAVLSNCVQLDEVLPENTQIVLLFAASESECASLIPPFMIDLLRKSRSTAALELTRQLLLSESKKCVSNTLDVLSTVIETIENEMVGKWHILLEPLGKCAQEKINVGNAFGVVKQIASQIGTLKMEECLDIVNVVGQFTIQENDINVSLSAIQLLWDMLESVTGDQMMNNGLSEKDVLMLNILRVMKQTVNDSRYVIWGGMVQTLLRALGNVSTTLSSIAWANAIDEILLPVLEQLRNEIYCRIADIQVVPEFKKSNVKINSYLNSMMREWNEIVVVVLSGLIRLIPTFNKFEEEFKLKIFNECIVFANVAFYKPTYITIETVLKYLHCIKQHTTQLVTIKENVLLIENEITQMVILNNGINTSLIQLFASQILNEGTSHSINILFKLINVYPDDHYLVDNKWSSVQQLVITGLEKLSISSLNEKDKESIRMSFIDLINELSKLKTTNNRINDSKWYCFPLLIEIAMNWKLKIYDSILQIIQLTTTHFTDEISVGYGPKQCLSEIRSNIIKRIESVSNEEKVIIAKILFNIEPILSISKDEIIEVDCIICNKESLTLFNTIVNWCGDESIDLSQRIELIDIVIGNCQFFYFGLKQSICAYESVLCLLENKSIEDIVLNKFIISLNKCFERYNKMIDSSSREICYVMDDIFSILIQMYKDYYPQRLSSMIIKTIYQLTIGTITSSNIEIRVSALAVLKSLSSVLLQ
ncbi:hypothetical protein ENUP19_0265G0020 [Entamoeba nuttalli]|uniref:Mon2/Sec7/BIG1-like dimerisation and cyclophilin-binding domain-containing protein n=2 Tax=Entamoeba nuttalli TaxID=412467 RepID=K2GPU1_ENTNP|nr:hypothetical protein ENU1_213640 [Entamoeba nuttalli P19]EKE36963.1 hypothetical protein ENU1_213640 [Entamoeba nuttalli P19]|eukprot:XP_008860703.1 hypothetical protein ENU1_213640 [Entamoeba nuttalli P19]